MNPGHSLIVGGTKGVGLVLARAMAAAGQSVSVIGRRPPMKAEDLAGAIQHWPVDITDQAAVSKALPTIINQNGKLNSLVFLQRHKSEESKWAGELETSLSATKHMIESLVDHFSPTHDRSIVLVSSAAANVIADEQGLGYHVAKAGINQMTRYFAVTLGSKGIRVNSVSPGTILKDENRDFYQRNQALQKLFERVIPLGRMGTAEEIAEVILFLCSSKASFITGQNLLVDGGINLLSPETLARKLAG